MHVLMVDYNGTCNEEGMELGHSSKVLHEYAELINTFATVSALLSPCIVRKAVKKDFNDIRELSYDIVQAKNNGIVKRIIDKWYIFCNLVKVFAQKDIDTVFFYKMDFFLAVYLCIWKLFHKKSDIKYVGLVCQQKFEVPLASLINYIYRQGVRCLDGLIYTVESVEFRNENAMYMPDYYYLPSLYDKYRCMQKQEKVICVGTMNYYKELDELVDCFNHSTYPLEICGHFMDKDMLEQLKKKANNNIKIIDSILNQEEYYTLIGSAKYSILPYNMQQYKARTSGVLFETTFLESIPIAPRELLDYNHIQGIAYDSWENVKDWLAAGAKSESYLFKADNKKVIYTFEEIRVKLQQFLGEI